MPFDIKHVHIIGLGALGTMYAAKFREYDPACVSIIADRERIERYRAAHIIVNGKVQHFEYAEPTAGQTPADLILVAVKHGQLLDAAQQIRPFIGKNTSIISLLNGISSEREIGEIVGMEHLLYGYGVQMDALRIGREVTHANMGKIVFGEPDNSLSDRVKAIRTLFEQAGIPYIVPPDIRKAQWSKFMLNVAVNQVSTVLLAPFAVFRDDPDARELLKLAAREVLAIAGKLDIGLQENDIAAVMETIKGLNPAGKSSMLQDMEAGRLTELDIFAGEVIRLGQQHGIATPVNNVLYHTIRSMEKARGIR